MQQSRSSSIVIAILGVLACGSAAPAQTPAPKPVPPAAPASATAADLPDGESLFAKHVAAVGGLEALRSQKSAMIKARIASPGGSPGLLTVWRKAPDKMYKILDFPGRVTVETWCDGENAWIRDTNQGAVKLSGEALAVTKVESEFIGEANFKSRYKELKTSERTTFADRPAYAVAAITSLDKARTLYFDAERGFLIGIKLAMTGPRGGEVVITVTFGDYKQFGATWQPTTIVESAGDTRTTTTFTQMEFDVTAMPSLDPPDEIKNLKKK